MNIFTQFFQKYFSSTPSTENITRDLIQNESSIGREVFGPVPRGVRREFFCLDENTWVWHEEKNGVVTVTRYIIKPTEIIKSVNGETYHRLSLKEADHFTRATKLYATRVYNELYAQLNLA